MYMKETKIVADERMYGVLSRMLELLGMDQSQSITPEIMEQALLSLEFIMEKEAISVKKADLAQDTPDLDLEKTYHSQPYEKALVLSKLGSDTYQIKHLLASENIYFSVFENPYTALIDFVKKLQDLVIVDKTMIPEDITSIYREIKQVAIKNNVKTNIILVASALTEEQKSHYHSHGVDIILEKHSNWVEDLTYQIEKNKDTALVELEKLISSTEADQKKTMDSLSAYMKRHMASTNGGNTYKKAH